jgi:hypothetical protein
MDSSPTPALQNQEQDSVTELKTLSKDFWACKDKTIVSMDNLDQAKSGQDVQNIMKEQQDCLSTLIKLDSKYGNKVTRYKKAMKETAARLKTENFLLKKTLEGDQIVFAYGFYTLKNVRESENREWVAVESTGKDSNQTGFHPSLFLMTGWAFFIFVIILIFMKGKDFKTPLPFYPEKVKLYFEEEKAKFSKFLIKILKKDEDDKK